MCILYFEKGSRNRQENKVYKKDESPVEMDVSESGESVCF